MAAHVDFDFVCSYDEGVATGIPEWDTGGPHSGRATRGFIEKICGRQLEDHELEAAFADHVALTAQAVAADKYKASHGHVVQPVVLEGGDAPRL